MFKMLFLLLLLQTNLQAASPGVFLARDCRQVVVDARLTLREPISSNSFSVLAGDDFHMTPNEFNALPSDDQSRLFNQLKPLRAMVQETIRKIDSTIGLLMASPYGTLLRADAIQELRIRRDELRSCL